MCKDKPFVSVLVPTANRRKFIPMLLKYFNDQDYQGKMELVILDTGEDKVEDLIPNNPQVLYTPGDKIPIGAARNILNNLATGEIMICMDDDDYYPPERVSHAVEQLLAYPDKLIAGCSSTVIYFPDLKCLMETPAKHPYHATNATLAYRREYLKNNRYDQDADRGEEKSFTRNFTNPLIQLDHRKTLLSIAHAGNTINKKKLLTYSTPVYFRPIETVIDDSIACEFINELGREIRAEKEIKKDGSQKLLI